MTYAASLAFLYALQKHGIKLGLEPVARLLNALGDPHRRYPVLHIAGTNGKGSTAAMAAAMLRAADYRVGLYTSPHLVDFRERMRVDDELMSMEALTALVEQVRGAAAAQEELTFFEFTTAMAFEHFARMHVDVAVIEVGMGGRFDATNVVQPLATTITTVALDHQAYLGHTVAAIAYEKAGIVKPGVPLTVGSVPGEAWAVIRDIALARQAPVRRWGSDVASDGDPRDGFTIRTRSRTYAGLRMGLSGRHQLQNAACAVAMIEDGATVLAVSETAIRRGLQSVTWEGRLEVIDHAPLTVLDGAHNPSAAAVVADYLQDRRRAAPESRIILVVAMMRDKDHEAFLSAILPFVDAVVVTSVSMDRAATVGEMLATPAPWPGDLHSAPRVAEALAQARAWARPHDVICITGSLMLVGEVKALLKGCEVSLLRG